MTKPIAQGETWLLLKLQMPQCSPSILSPAVTPWADLTAAIVVRSLSAALRPCCVTGF